MSGHAAYLHHRAGPGEGEHHRHLQHDSEGIANRIGVEFLETLGAIAALQQKGLAIGDLGQLRAQAAGLPREYQRRIATQLILDPITRRGVRIGRRLSDRFVTPTRRCPGHGHDGPFDFGPVE